MRIGQSRPRALATSLAGLLTDGSGGLHAFPVAQWPLVNALPLTAAGTVDDFHAVPMILADHQ